MKIKVIMTGGTISSQENNGIISNKANMDIVDCYSKNYPLDFEVTKAYPYSILSENITLKNWESLIQELNQSSGFDGIIITHGSDTLSYTSAMVAIYCQNTKIPLVLTGANKVLTHPDSNGIANFHKAIDLIKNKKVGVWTVFDNVYLAKSVMEANCFTDKFTLGNTIEKSLNIYKNILFKNTVTLLKEYPFADYSHTTFSPHTKAVLLIGYHSGTANENSVEALLKQCKKFNIPLYLQGVSYESGLYSSSENIIKKGAIPLYDMTPEYAYAYLIFKVNSTSENQC